MTPPKTSFQPLFEEIYTGKLFGAIRGFDKLRFRGTIRELNTGNGIIRILNYLHTLMKDFRLFFKTITDTMLLNAKGYCQSKGIQYIWRMGETDKDAMAKVLLGTFPEGCPSLFDMATIENCPTVMLVSNKEAKLLEAQMLPSKYTHLYLYFNVPEYGLGHIRLMKAHGLAKKAPCKNRYMITEYGHKLCTAIALADNVTGRELGEKAV